MSNDKILLAFESTRSVIVAERECKKNGFQCTAVPIPKGHTATCGIVLEIPVEQKTEIIKLLNQLDKSFLYV